MRLILLLVLSALPAAAAPAPIRLQALVATSGANPERLIDGDEKTSWKPDGDATLEGVLLRFEEPVKLGTLTLRRCGAPTLFDVFANGVTVYGDDAGVQYALPPKVRSLFVKSRASTGCLTELAFKQGRESVPILPPRIVQGHVQASSVLSPADAYHPSFLVDGRLEFGWVEGADGTGAGESITLTLDTPVDSLTGLELWNGYQRSDDHFRKNARAKKVRVAIDDRPPVELAVKDAQGPQLLPLPPGRASKITLTVLEVTAGTRYPDLVLSELRLRDANGPISVRTPDREERRSALVAELKDRPVGAILDRVYTGYCDNMEPPVFRLRSDHSFVWYQEKEVADGAWVPSRSDGAWNELELFARLQRTTATEDPYARVAAKTATRVAGGKLRVARVKDLSEREFAALVTRWAKAGVAAAWCLKEPKAWEELRTHDAIVVEHPLLTEVLWRQ